MSNVRLGMPSREAIAGYWGEDPNSCWKCGLQYRNREGTIDRCHIVPVMLGGKHTVDNLVILCRRCHVRAPDVMDPSFMWEFIEKGDEDGWQFFYDLSDLTREFFARPFVPEFMEKFPLVFDACLGLRMTQCGFQAGVVSHSSKYWASRSAMDDVSLRAAHWKRHGEWCIVCRQNHTVSPEFSWSLASRVLVDA